MSACVHVYERLYEESVNEYMNNVYVTVPMQSPEDDFGGAGFSLSNFTWIPEIKLGLPGLCGKPSCQSPNCFLTITLKIVPLLGHTSLYYSYLNSEVLNTMSSIHKNFLITTAIMESVTITKLKKENETKQLKPKVKN